MTSLNFILYPDSSFPRSLWANDVRTLTQLCQQFVGDCYSIEIVHIAESRRQAFHDGVFSTPAVLLEVEGGGNQLLGNLADAEKFLKFRNEPQACAEVEPLALLSILRAWKAARGFPSRKPNLLILDHTYAGLNQAGFQPVRS